MASRCLQLRTGGGFFRLHLRTLATGRSGAELFEFALVAPMLLALLLGIIWIGRAYNVYETITRAAREGARYAVLPNAAYLGNTYVDTYSSVNSCLAPTTNVFTNQIAPALTASNLNPNSVLNYCQTAVVMDSATDPSAQQCGVKITFAYPVQLFIPFTSVNATTINISTEVQMRMENQSINNSTGGLECP